MKWHVYILHCVNGSYYIGHTNSVDRRFARHLSGSGARHTAQYPPDPVVFMEDFPSEIEAIRRERQLKGWTRAKKQALIAEDLHALHTLARRHF